MGERDFPIRSRGDGTEVDYAMSADRSIALLGNVTLGTTITECEVGSAVRVLAGYARDAAELTTWLQMCGLLPYDAKPRTSFIPAARSSSYRRP